MSRKVPKKLELTEKSKKKKLEKPVGKIMSKKKKNYSSFSTYIYKLLKEVRVDMGISRKSMIIMNDFIYDMMERLASEAGQLVQKQKRNTMVSRDVHAAVYLILPGELALQADIGGKKAIKKYHDSNQDYESLEEQ